MLPISILFLFGKLMREDTLSGFIEEKLSDQNYQILVVAERKTPVIENLEKLGCRVIIRQGMKWRKINTYLRLGHNLFFLKKLVEKNRVRLIQSGGRSTTPLALLTGRITGARVVTYLKSYRLGNKKTYKKFWIPKADGIISVSKATLKAYERLFPSEYNHQKNRGIYETESLRNIQELAEEWNPYERFPLKKEELKMGFVGTLNDNKNPLLMLEIASKLTKYFPRLRLIFIGTFSDERYRLKFETFMKDQGLKDKCLVTGYLANPFPLIRSLDILFHPSRREAMGRVILESMALKIPVVASSIGGIPELVENGISGILCSPEDKEGFFLAIKSLLENEAKRIQMGEKGLEIIKKKLNPKISLQQLEAYYNNLLY